MPKLSLILAAALVTVVAAGCGGQSPPREQVGTFVTRILREEINGQWGLQWTELHPGHQRLITRDAYVACSRRMNTDIATGGEIFRVKDVRDAAIHVDGVKQQTSKLVTITFRQGGSTGAPLTYFVHAVAVDGHWRWILGGKFLTAIARGQCLDGSPLQSST